MTNLTCTQNKKLIIYQVIVHECQAGIEKMDFNSKNFRYVTETFKSFLQRAEAGGPLYMRSLSQEKPSEAPANVSDDFPSIAQDMQIPEELHFIKENLFSSILRISGRVNMWLHYDVRTLGSQLFRKGTQPANALDFR